MVRYLPAHLNCEHRDTILAQRGLAVVVSAEVTKRVVRCGLFEANLSEGLLTKSGIRIKLQHQPFRILTMLLEHPGDVVGRDEIRKKLWPEDTFVEFDDGLNTAIR